MASLDESDSIIRIVTEKKEPKPTEEKEPYTVCQERDDWNPWCRSIGEGWTYIVRQRKHYDKVEKMTHYFSPRWVYT